MPETLLAVRSTTYTRTEQVGHRPVLAVRHSETNHAEPLASIQPLHPAVRTVQTGHSSLKLTRTHFRQTPLLRAIPSTTLRLVPLRRKTRSSRIGTAKA